MDKIRIGSRGSALAMWQAKFIADALMTHYPTLEVEIVRIKTKGDRILDTPLSKIGGKGLFIKEIETQLIDGTIDLAVHSLKDVPTELPPQLTLAAITRRDDPFDAFVSKSFGSIDELPRGAVVGTSSLRRRAQLLAIRSDICVENLRGNVETRLRKLDEGQFDAVILAAIGLKRLGFSDRISEIIAPSKMLPAVGQGALAIEIVRDNQHVNDLVAFLDDATTRAAVTAERSFLGVIGGGCQVPIGVYASIIDDKLHVEGVIASTDGRTIVRDEIVGELSDTDRLGKELAATMLERGGRSILRTI